MGILFNSTHTDAINSDLVKAPLDRTRVTDQHNLCITVNTHAKGTLMDLKTITEKGHIVWIIVTLIQCAGFKSH